MKPKSAAKRLKVGDLATRADSSVRALHYYEELGLPVPSHRTTYGHRLYTGEDVVRLQQIKSLRALGFSLEEVRECLRSPRYSPINVIEDHAARAREQLDLREKSSSVSTESPDFCDVARPRGTQRDRIGAMKAELPRRRVIDVWTWLPAFRAVAEVEHVHHAARDMHVTASSLSRAVKLLEERVGKQLFRRSGRNVRLNADGETLLEAVSDGMRRIDDAIARITGTTLSGEVRVACEGDQPLVWLSRAASQLMAQHPDVTTCIEEITSRREIASRLLRGELDAAVMTGPPSHARLSVERVGEITYGIYCGVGHPLCARRAVDLRAIVKHPFVAPSGAPDGPDDQWPRHQPRNVVLRLPALAAAVAACESGELLAVIPDTAATPTLRRLPSDAIAPSALFAVRRRGVGDETSKADAFVSELRRLGLVTAPRGPKRKAAGPSRRGAR